MKKILLGDIDKNSINLLKRFLELQGYSVSVTTSESQFLTSLKDSKFDLIFLDTKLTKNVVKTLKDIKINLPDMPIVITTDFSNIKSANDCVNHGALTYLQKPFISDKIKKIMSEIQI